MYNTIEIRWKTFEDRDYILNLFNKQGIKYVSSTKIIEGDSSWEIITLYGDPKLTKKIYNSLY